MSTDLIPVEGVPCPCPGSPHTEGDTVYLHPHISFRGGVLAEKKAIDAIQAGEGDYQDAVQAALLETYVLHGVADWTLTNGDGVSVIPVNEDSITRHLLSNYGAALMVAEQANDLYKEEILGPLRTRLLKSLPRSRTTVSTSARTGSSAERPKRLKRSSTSTSAKEQPSE